MTHHWDDEIADVNATVAFYLLDATERLVAEDESIVARGSLAVFAVDDLPVRSADADREPTHEYAPRCGSRHIVEARAVRDTWDEGQRAHASHRRKSTKTMDSRRGTIDTMLVT